jgi:molecular chaperone DnaK
MPRPAKGIYVKNDLRGIVGIDLGTTMSVIAHINSSGLATTLMNAEGEPLTPSAVYIDGREAVVGKAAKQAAGHFPDKVATFIKREMGKSAFPRAVDGRQFRVETLSAIILRKLKQDAERHIGPVSKAVITVPAFFDDARRKATEDAGRIAGLDVLDIVNEPTAAALAYSLEQELANSKNVDTTDIPLGNMTALVYDLGGGTFDVTVVQLASKLFNTVATDGEVKLGGKDWDDQIVEHVGKVFAQKYGVNPAQDPARRNALQDLAETAKKLLSKLPSAPMEFSSNEHSLKLTLSRGEFEDLTRRLLGQTEFVTDMVVRDQAKTTWEEIDRVLLVGGSTRMPMVKRMLRELTGMEPDDSLDPDQAVARGAALFAAVLTIRGKVGELEVDEAFEQMVEQVVINDVNAHSLGIVARNNKTGKAVNAILIPKNTKLPYAASKLFRLTKAGVTTLPVRVLEGEAPDAEGNIEIGKCVVSNLPPNLPARSPVQVRLSYATDCRVHVMALDMTGGKFARAEIVRKSGLTEDDIAREAEFVRSLNIQ